MDPEDYLSLDEQDAVLNRIRTEAQRRQSLRADSEAAVPRWRLLIGLTCGHRYWLRRDRWKYPAVLPHLYCPQCDVLQPVRVASRRKVRKRMDLPTADLRRVRDQAPKPARLGREPRNLEAMHVLEVASREVDPVAKVEAMKTPRGMNAQLECGHTVRLQADRVQLALDPGQLECPNGHGRQQVSAQSRTAAKRRLGFQ